jgi:capsular polysaccharide biosynthesis protein
VQTPFFARILLAIKHQWQIVLGITALGFIAAIAVAVFTQPKYIADTSVLMVAGSAQESPSQDLATSTKPLLSSDLPSLAKGPTVLQRLRTDLGETVPLESLRSHISAKVSTDSTIMQVEYSAPNPNKAIQGANALGDEITKFYRELATARFDSLIADLQMQLKSRKAELEKADGTLADVAKIYPFIDVTAAGPSEYGATSVYQRLVGLRTDRDQLEANLRADEATARSTEGIVLDAKAPAVREILQSDAIYSRIRDQYAKDTAELKRLSAYGSERYPGLIELRRTVSREAQDVASASRQAMAVGPSSNASYATALDARVRAAGQVASDKAKLAQEDQVLGALYAQIGKKGIASKVAGMRRDHDSAEAAYSIIAARLAKSIADRAEASSTGSVIVLDRAQFASRALLGSGTVAAIAIVFLSLWLALSIGLMVENAQQWMNEGRSVETIYGAPVIGSVV